MEPEPPYTNRFLQRGCRGALVKAFGGGLEEKTHTLILFRFDKAWKLLSEEPISTKDKQLARLSQ